MAVVSCDKIQRMRKLAEAMEKEEREENAANAEEDEIAVFLAAFTDAAEKSGQGNFEEAVAAWTHALGLDDSSSQVWQERASARAALGQFAEAEADLAAALARVSTDEDRASVYFSRGSLHGDAGDEARAIVDFGEALKLDPERLETWLSRGTAYLAQGDTEHASADAEAALKLNRKSGAAWGLLGAVRQRQGLFREAIEACQTALELDPELTWAERCLEASLAKLEAEDQDADSS
eukprot:gb/GFBE01011141.1/.p1 GENE.gb/GFBE01011141.1/~~gb/GFBE01011141.1/.p1  ORF type:complete len:236 (+),score=66.75 gb/GFBE01011141.1/:1-708(+)